MTHLDEKYLGLADPLVGENRNDFQISKVRSIRFRHLFELCENAEKKAKKPN